MGGVTESRREQSPPHRSPTTAGSTKDAILDSAETLFGEVDVATVTMRSIADAAGVDPASITYHFGGKMDVVAAVLRRRYTVLREHWMQALTLLLAQSDEIPTARELLDTVYRPWFELVESEDPGWRNYSRLVASMPNSEVIADLMRDHSGQWEQALITALNRAYPDADQEVILQAFTLTLGAALSFASSPRLHLLSSGPVEPGDFDLKYSQFLHFVSSGFESMVSAPVVEL